MPSHSRMYFLSLRAEKFYGIRKGSLMSRSNALLWTLVILFAVFVIWLVATGRLQAVADMFVDGYLKFMQNIVSGLRK